jgi:hypothetical protein
VAPNSNGQIQLNETGTLAFPEPKDAPMRKLIIASLLVVLTLPLAAGTKDTGKTTLKDVQTVGTTDKKNKHQQYDLLLSSTSGKDYTCRTKAGEKINAAEFMVGGNISYEIKGNKGKIKSDSGKELDCTIVRVALTPAATPPPSDAPAAATKPNQ